MSRFASAVTERRLFSIFFSTSLFGYTIFYLCTKCFDDYYGVCNGDWKRVMNGF